MAVDIAVNSIRYKIKTNITSKYKVYLVVFISLMLIFGTSKLWLPSDVKIMNTTVGTELNTSPNTSIKLRSWEYSKANQYMEIMFDVHNNEDSQSLKFTPVAHTNIEKRRDMNVSTALSKDGTLVVQIKDVPKNWEIISLWVKDNMEADSNDTTKNGANFFCDIRKIVLNNSLKPKSQLNYQVESIQNQIADVNAQITDTENEIKKENTQIDQLNFDIQALKENQKYQTKQEISKSNSVISGKNTEIDNHKNSILKYQEQIKDYNAKLRKLNLKLQDTKNGKIPVTDAPASIANSSTGNSSGMVETVD